MKLWYISPLLAAVLVLPAPADGPVRRVGTWAVLGPFPFERDGYEEAPVPDEATLRPALGESVASLPWRLFDDRYYCRNYDDYNDLYTYFLEGRAGGPGGGAQNQVAYCGMYVWSPKPQYVSLRFRANDRAKVWLNGVTALAQADDRQAQRDTQVETVHLESGWNTAIVKVVNTRRNWGFYFNLTDAAGKPLDGLEYTPYDPETAGPLQIVTPALPDGYNNQPYLWLDVRNPGGKFPGENPSASPLRLLARGGTPPYTWQVAGLPEGLTLHGNEGEFRGRTHAMGTHTLSLTVTDSASPPAQTATEMTLAIKPRPTELWWETGSRLGSLRHHVGADATHWAFDHAEEQVEILKRQGYDWQAYTAFAWWTLREDGTMAVADSPAMQHYRDTLRAEGIRFAQYMNLFDFRDLAPNGKAHVENMHEALELLMRQNAPALWWFDSSLDALKQHAEFDALFSLVRTLDPNCLITVNNDIRARDYECGDLDLLQVHGSFQTDSYWGHWPPSPLLGNNPKFMPVDSWRLPWKGFMDPAEWCKVIVSMLAEPANLEAPRTVDIDTTPVLEDDYNMVALHRGIADWLEPRKASILGTVPLQVPPVDWGYVVRQPKSGDVYLHILSNGIGKRGLFERVLLDVEPLEGEVAEVSVFPGGAAVPFTLKESRLTVDMRGVALDPVDTILQVKMR